MTDLNSDRGKSSKKRSAMAAGENQDDAASKKKIFNDSIHGHVELHPLLVKIIDTPQFQRLRNIKQLGGGYFVFPGASHNRFEHSIGVAYLAGKLAKILRENQEELGIDDKDILCVEIAGLCHDLGHGPFSHLYDGMFIPEVRGQHPDFKHEKISIRMFDHMVNANEKLKKAMKNLLPEDLTFIKEMIAGPLESNENTEQEWPYKGRPMDKSFLYEIVANKNSGIDVDKFDYFARDCHHLGIQNNFDHTRFIMLARVCEVHGMRHICMRDKEVRNLYDMFYTRISLHRRAYQHRVNKVIEVMIKDALVKADKWILIKGSGRKTFSLSTAIEDMKAFTKLTDSVFDQILNPLATESSLSPELDEARTILERIVFRQLYTFLGQTKARREQDEEAIEVTKEVIATWKKELAHSSTPKLDPEDFVVLPITLNYGKKNENPVNYVYFYSKGDHNTVEKIPEEQLSDLHPRCFCETLILFYYKNDESLDHARTRYREWCLTKRFKCGNAVGL